MLTFQNRCASFFVPDGGALEDAIRKCTHFGVGAHPDDLEFMALHGIIECFHSREKWFGGVICTNGAGSARGGNYSGMAPDELAALRRREQEAAALAGRYGVVVQLGYPSADIKNEPRGGLAAELAAIFELAQPEVLYTHNPADRHDTHLAVLAGVLEAIRRLPPGRRPRRVLGCEVWRSLDWLGDAERVLLDVSGHGHLVSALTGVFDSQIDGGKRYDLAVRGRLRANATFCESHRVDASAELLLAVDLTPLTTGDGGDVVAFTRDLIEKFKTDAAERLARYFPA